MNRAIWLIIIAFVLAGCTAKTAATDESGLLHHMTADFQIQQEHTDTNSIMQHLQVKVTYAGEPFIDAQQATFKIWPEQDKDAAIELQAVESASGIYSATYVTEQAGLFLVQAIVGSGQHYVLPIRRLAIGLEAQQALLELEKEQPQANPALQQHDHHGHH